MITFVAALLSGAAKARTDSACDWARCTDTGARQPRAHLYTAAARLVDRTLFQASP